MFDESPPVFSEAACICYKLLIPKGERELNDSVSNRKVKECREVNIGKHSYTYVHICARMYIRGITGKHK